MLCICAAAASDEPIVRITTHLVEVNVIVEDKSGQAITGLQQGDFSIFDNGKPRDISVFSLNIARQRLYPETGAAPPLVIANRAIGTEAPSMPIDVILFDGLNIEGVDAFMYAKTELVRFLKTLDPEAPVAIYSLNGPTVRVLRDFSTDATSLVQAAQRLSSVNLTMGGAALSTDLSGMEMSGHGAAQMEEFLGFIRESYRADEDRVRQMRMEWTLSALESIAGHLEGIPGRKNLIWISGANPITIGFDSLFSHGMGPGSDVIPYFDREQRLARLLSQAQVSIYPLEPYGVMVDSKFQASSNRGGILTQDPANGLAQEPTVGQRREPSRATMLLLASKTGGFAIFDANDLAGSIRRAVDDARVTYTLGFYPPEDAWDGKYHELKVKLTRRSGLKVRSPEGYLARVPAEDSPSDRDQALKTVAASPLEGTAIGVKVSVNSNPLEPGAEKMILAIDPHDIVFGDVNGRMHGFMDVLFAQYAADGRMLGGEKKTLQYALLPESYQKALRKGLPLTERLTVQPQTAKIRVVVRDATTGAVGSVSVPVRSDDANYH